jgi:hypothetical protein
VFGDRGRGLHPVRRSSAEAAAGATKPPRIS